MEKMNRRSAMRAATAGAVVVGTAVLGSKATGNEKAPKLWTLEGELKVHPKYLYRYYLVLGDGAKCALYGSDQLGRLQLPARIRVRGVLGTLHHSGGTKENPSPFPETWVLYMHVHEVEALK
jgi:hypothetical protein